MSTLKKLAVLSLFIFNIAVFAAEPVKPTAPDASNIYSENKLNIYVDSKHPEFIIKVKSNPTTGYSWFLREYDKGIITAVKHSFQAPTKKLMGAPGFELWTFRVKPAGFIVPQQTTIRLIYARPWQSDDSATQLVFRVTTQAN